MRHRKAGRQLRRTSEQKLALMRNLATSLIESESIETTEAKAKELRPVRREARHQGAHGHAARPPARRPPHPEARGGGQAVPEIGPRFATRNGGYTRILKTGHRKGDGAEMARIEFCQD
jgi:large subunit ribosomal protein L17